jgi:exodeoxyribonuclease VII small subunit
MTGPSDAPSAIQPAGPTATAGVPLDVEALSFDAALAELERTVATLESGGGPLEETIALYEQAVALERRCSGLLAEARLRMEQLVERAGGGLETTPIRAEGSSGEA